MKECLKGKRTELLMEMLVEARVPSPDYVVALLRRGAPPFGELPASGAFEPRHHGATKSLKQVLQAGKWSKAVLRSTVRPNRDAELDREVADRTDEEVRDGKAPFDEEEVDNLLGKCWSPCRRVDLRQGSAIRSIDDFSEFGHNGSSGTCEYQEMSRVDGVCAMMKRWCSAVNGGGVEVKLSTGEVRRGELHEGFRGKSFRAPVGRALDMRKAKKQVPICPSMQCLCVVALWHPKHKRLKYYVLLVLPFRARNSVYTFGTVAFALSC